MLCAAGRIIARKQATTQLSARREFSKTRRCCLFLKIAETVVEDRASLNHCIYPDHGAQLRAGNAFQCCSHQACQVMTEKLAK
jgi:hypothetical protein